MNWYVYALIDPRNGEPFYIGKGCGDRLSKHVLLARRGKVLNLAKMATILEIHADGLEVGEVVLAQYGSETAALQDEAKLIACIPFLTNNSSSGKGTTKVRQAQAVAGCEGTSDSWLRQSVLALLQARGARALAKEDAAAWGWLADHLERYAADCHERARLGEEIVRVAQGQAV